MSQTAALVNALKRALKAKGKTYADVARCLDLSENSVKRLFTEKSFSIERLERVCHLLDFEISDLVQHMLEGTRQVDQLTLEQEQDIAANTPLLLVAICVLNRWTFAEILSTYQLTEFECVQLLAKLDRLHLIELLPNNRVNLIVSKNFTWRPDGPIQQFFLKIVQPDFFKSRFQKAGEKLIFHSGMLSPGSNATLMKKLERLAAEFHELHDEDLGLALTERHGTSLVLAMRPWEFSPFAALRRKPDKKHF